MRKRFVFLILATAVLMLAGCKDSARQRAAENGQDATEFFDAESAAAAQKTKAAAESGERDASDSKSNAPKGITQYELPAPLKGKPEQILKREAYTVSYNKTTRNPNWVAWHLTKSHTYGRISRDKEIFTEDTSVGTPRATDNDYYTSRYDRGHMCPAGDNKWSNTAMTESFLFTNVCPQNHGLNKYEWNDLEMLCRDWAREYGSVDIVCGPIYYGQGDQKTIGKNKVWVPDAFFKVVLCRKGASKAIGFIYRNEGRKQRMEDAVCTVDEVERLTGIDFFPSLKDDVEERVEAEATISKW